MADDEGRSSKLHRARQSGPKAVKKKKKNEHEQELTDRQRNPKAFAVQSVVKRTRAVRRTLDIQTKKHHIPLVDRTPLEPPPIVVAVVGPPKVGKSTLIQGLIRNFTRQNLPNVQGPVTVVSGKRRRLTLLECKNDINCMIDIAKVADLVLLMIDASFGFEMETFEFLNIVQVHGFPKIMGVLTHLDTFKNSKALKKTKKRMKHRFWTEIYQGAKLFYVSGMVHGEYNRADVHNLGRFISVMKFRPLIWRSTHPYVVADRMEDLTDPEQIRHNSKCDRMIALYGYVRGTPLKANSNVHIPGCGDFPVQDITFLPDPCPLPEKHKKRALNERERLIYAPLSGVGGIVYDKDVVYVDLGDKKTHSQTITEEDQPTNELVSNIIGTQQTIDSKMAASKLSLFQESQPISSEQVTGNPTTLPVEKIIEKDGRTRRRVVFGQEESDAKDSGRESDENEDNDDDDDDDEEDDDEEEEEDDDNSKDETIKRKDSGKKPQVDNRDIVYADSDDDDFDVDPDELLKSGVGGVKLKLAEDKMRKVRTKPVSKKDDDNDEGDDDEDDDGGDYEQEGGEDDDSSVTMETDKESENADSPRTAKQKSDKIEKDLSKTDKNKKDEKAQEEDVRKDKKEKELAAVENDEDWDENDVSMDTDDSSDQDDADQEEILGKGHLKWKENLGQKASSAFLDRQADSKNLKKIVYGQVMDIDDEDDSQSDDVGGLFSVVKVTKQASTRSVNGMDCSRFDVRKIVDWDLEEIKEQIQDCFVTGKWKESEDAEKLLQDDDEMFGDFEDLETGEKHHGSEEGDADSDGSNDEELKKEDEEKEMGEKEKRMDRKRKMKEAFDAEYDDKDGGTSYYDELKQQLDEQAQINRAEFEDMEDDVRVLYEGYRPGLYVRVELANVSCEFVTNFDPTYPMILGGLLNSEENIGFVQVRLKKHRWYDRILKTRDPLIISLGWRRFQTLPMYSIQDHNGRHRLLKYTPEHLHCHATIWGPITPPGTGILGIQSVCDISSRFRIAATGTVLDLDKSVTIVKKLKLTGAPFKIYKNTAFIKGMFSSQLEVAKFEGAAIRSVSGIRGQIKKSVRTPEGAFRATFEDKLIMSDIVFVRTWYPVMVPKFYNPVTSLLLPKDRKDKWVGMKTTGQLRKERNLAIQQSEDSLYKPIARKPRVFNPIRIPKQLQKELPFNAKPKQDAIKKKKQKVDPLLEKHRVVIREPGERRVVNLLRQLSTINQHKTRKQNQAMKMRVKEHRNQMKVQGDKLINRQRKEKKEMFRLMGKLQKKKDNQKKD